MLRYGSVAVALVQRQVMVVQAAHTYDRGDGFLEVYTFAPFHDRIFNATAAPCARIAPGDLLTIFPDTDVFSMPARDTLELPPQAFGEYHELRTRHLKTSEKLWAACMAKLR